ncbi:hypothetical protein TWF730_001633 [Orbilia blumenaviensis]|uniref:CFEM domain-containing protein n=1 Tax=Orbilia blumenaviensis TaxID=1796055 RepID=A0AAV9ULD4_9PEZI
MGFQSIYHFFPLILLILTLSASAYSVDNEQPRPPNRGLAGRSVYPPQAGLRPRQQPTDTSRLPAISFEDFPDHFCATFYCLPTKTENPFDCESSEIPCAKDPSQTCTVLDHQCFCSQPSALYCAWYCGWFEWFQIEDWYSDVCPEVPKINFDGLPSCAQECMIDETTSYGCVSHTRSCFCSKDSLYGCTDKCDTTEKKLQVIDWYATQCTLAPSSVSYLYTSVTMSASSAALTSQTQTTGASPSPTGPDNLGPGIYKIPNRKLKWYEIYGLAMFLLTVTFVASVYLFLITAQRSINIPPNASEQKMRRGSMDKA